MFLHPWLLKCLIWNNVMDTKEYKEFVSVSEKIVSEKLVWVQRK